MNSHQHAAIEWRASDREPDGRGTSLTGPELG